MELHDYIRLLRRRWRLLVAILVFTVGLSVVVTIRAVPQYRSSVQFFISTPTRASDSASAYNGSLFSQERVKSYAAIVAGRGVADDVASQLGLPASQVEGHISAQAEAGTVLLDVSVKEASPQDAFDIARAVAAALPLTVQKLEHPLDLSPSAVRVSVVESPEVPRYPVSPSRTRNIGLGLVLGLLSGVGIAVLREALDNSVSNSDDVRSSAGTATLAAIVFDPSAKKQPLLLPSAGPSLRSEAFRQLRTNLQFIEIDHALRSVTITSSISKEGKSTTACNLAITLAEAGISVVLVEGDLRRPMIAEYLGIEGRVGLTSVLVGRTSLEEALQPWGPAGLRVLASGPLPPNPSELLSSNGLRDLIASLEGMFDVVVVDAPPLLPITDAAILASLTSGAILAVRCGTTTRDQLRRAAEALNAVDATILGAVLNMVPRRGTDSYRSYAYGYGYGDAPRSRTAAGSKSDAKPVEPVRRL